MKKWYVGVDGGGTKTAIMAATKTDGETGVELTAGCSYQMLGVEGATKMIADGVKSSLQKLTQISRTAQASASGFLATAKMPGRMKPCEIVCERRWPQLRSTS